MKPQYLFLVSLLTGLVATALVRLVASRVGFVSKPRGDRWNQRTVALGGGIGVFLGFIPVFFLMNPRDFWTIAPGLILVFLTGFIDDLYHITPAKKLLGQLGGAALLVSGGFYIESPITVVSIALTIPWFIGFSNALNLSDNMDGLAIGLAVVSAFFFWCLFPAGSTEAMIALALLGSGTGFLFHNFFPARIFMGDAGSLFLGMTLALLATRIKPHGAPFYIQWFIMVSVLIVPLFDTLLVTIARSTVRRPITTGGRDHTSHRLVKLGLTEKKSVLVLYLMGAVGGVLGYVIMSCSVIAAVAVMLVFITVVTQAWVFIMNVKVYDIVQKSSKTVGAYHTLPKVLLFFIEFSLDVGMITVTWTLAHYFRFWDAGTSNTFSSYYQTFVVPWLPYVILVKVGALLFFRLYKGYWNTVTTDDVYRFFKAISISTVLLTTTFFFSSRWVDSSRSVIILDWALTMVFLIGVRTLLIGFRRWMGRLVEEPRKLIILTDQMDVGLWVFKILLDRQTKTLASEILLIEGESARLMTTDSRLIKIGTVRDLNGEMALELKGANFLMAIKKGHNYELNEILEFQGFAALNPWIHIG